MTIKILFFILFVCTFVFPVFGMNADIHAPATPGRVPKVSNATLSDNAGDISKLLEASIKQIKNVEMIFSETYKKNKPEIGIKTIKDLLIKKKLLKDVFVPYFAASSNKRFTPDCKSSLGTHLADIDGNSPKTFLKKGRADFMKSVDPDNFYTLDTQEQNTFFLQKMLLDPEYGFGLYRKCNNTLRGLQYGEYNVLKLLEGNNPETRSGVVEFHHVYQNPEVITIVPYGEHKGNTRLYHKSKEDSRIDRQISELYYLKKIMGLLQVAKMCTHVLRDCDGLSDKVLVNMAYIDNYTGNVGLIVNPGAELKQKKKYTVEEAFLTHQALKVPDEDEDIIVISQFSNDERSASTEGSTSGSDIDPDNSPNSFQEYIIGNNSTVAPTSAGILTPSRSTNKKRKSRDDDNTDSESENDFTIRFLSENPPKTSHNSSE